MFAERSASPEDRGEMLGHVVAEETGDEEDDDYGNRNEEEMCVLEKWQGVVAEEGDHTVVDEGNEVYEISHKAGETARSVKKRKGWGVSYK